MMRLLLIVVCLFGLFACVPDPAAEPTEPAPAALQQPLAELQPDSTLCGYFFFLYDVDNCYEQSQSYLNWVCDTSYICTSTQCINQFGAACYQDVGTAGRCEDAGRINCRCSCYDP